MAYKSIILAALISIAAAIPQHAEHLGSAQIARSNGVLARTDLEGRTISYDGSCGSWSGYICGNGGCCSSQGWCGSTEAHCGVGCQEGFGQCSSGNAPLPIQSSSEIIPAPSTQVVEPTITSTTQAVQPPVVQTTQAPSPTHTTAALPPVIVSTDLPSFQTAGAGQAPAGPHTTIAFEPHTTVVPVQQTTTLAIPVTTSNPSSGLGDAYKMYLGDGSLAAGWPAQSEWLDFDTAFENNRGLMSQSCTQFGAANNNNDEIDSLKASLQSVASSTGVDARFLLAIMMQESGGCVRAPTTNYGVRNPGLFQSHNGAGSCNDGSSLSPCPASEITQMVTDGAAGTPSGDGLKQTIAEAATSDVSKYYRAARIYNSGSIAASGQLQDGIATHCYSADVANRLTGWVHAAHGCSLS